MAYRDQVHVPDTDQEIFKLEIFFKCVVHELVIFEEFSTSNRLVTTKLVVCIVEGGEHFKKAKAALLSVLKPGNHIRVSRGIEVILNLFYL